MGDGHNLDKPVFGKPWKDPVAAQAFACAWCQRLYERLGVTTQEEAEREVSRLRAEHSRLSAATAKAESALVELRRVAAVSKTITARWNAISDCTANPKADLCGALRQMENTLIVLNAALAVLAAEVADG